MSITPYLYYQNVAGALKFLAKAFGFRKYGVQIWLPDGKVNRNDLACLRCGTGSHPVCWAGNQGEAITGVRTFPSVIPNHIKFPKSEGVVGLITLPIVPE